jgi:hypothetical protein
MSLLWIIIVLLLVFGLKFKITIRWGQPSLHLRLKLRMMRSRGEGSFLFMNLGGMRMRRVSVI